MFRKKKKEAKIELYELWSLDHTLARIISRYLKEFIEASSLSGATPGIYCQKDPENCRSLWEADLWKMQKAFADYAALDCPAVCPEEKRKEIREGMQLFIDMYNTLWYCAPPVTDRYLRPSRLSAELQETVAISKENCEAVEKHGRIEIE